MKGDQIGGPIRWRMHIPAPPEAVFAVLDSAEGRASFWSESALEVEGHIEFRFINGYACRRAPISRPGRSGVLERSPPHILSIDYIGGPARFDKGYVDQ